jgi:hypothetical protein
MIKLEITILPKSSKQLEFSQSLNFIKPDLERLCSSLKVSEKNHTFTVTMVVDSVKKLMAALHSKELRLLSGAISTLGKNSDVVIHDGGNQRKVSDLREIRKMYAKKERKSINTNK